MPWHSGSLSDPNGDHLVNMANVQNLLRDHIVAAGWTLAEEFDATSGVAYHWKVFQCPAALSGLAKAFHVALIRNIGTGQIYVALFEDYTVGGTRAIAKYAPISHSTALRTLDATGSWSQAANPTNWTSYLNIVNLFVAQSASVDYQMLVTNDQIVLSLRSTQGWNTTYAGAFDSLVVDPATNDPVPLYLGQLGDTATAAATFAHMVTRHAMLTGSQTYTQSIYPPLLGATLNNPAPWSTEMTWAAPDLYGGGKIPMTEVLLLSATGVLQDVQSTKGLLRGKMKKIRRMWGYPSGLNYGDTLSFNGTIWRVAMLHGNGALWVDTGAVG